MTNAKKNIGYQGALGSYSYQACTNFFTDQNYRGYRFFHEVFRAVEGREIDFAVIPVENSTAGRVMEIYNLLPESSIKIVGEYLLPIHHCMMIPKKSLPQDTAERPLTAEQKAAIMRDILEVRSHPQALAQCRKFMEKNLPKAVGRDQFDTAGAARDLSDRNDYKLAAIASKIAATTYDMEIIAENVEDCIGNTTRFIVLTKDGVHDQGLPADHPMITTLLFETLHEPGSLLRALKIFEDYGVNLTKLETYIANPDNPNPKFYVDLNSSKDSKTMDECMAAFKNHTQNTTILGTYPASTQRGQGNSFLPVN